MPRLVATRPGAVAIVVDLSHFAYRIEFTASPWDDTPCLALSYIYPPSQTFMIRPQDGLLVDLRPYAQLALLRVPVSFADKVEDLTGVARAANESKDEATAMARTAEAFMLFRNSPRIGKDAVEEIVVQASALVKIAWEVRGWLIAGCADKQQWKLGEESVLIGQP